MDLEPDDDAPDPFAGWPWRSWGCEGMTHRRAYTDSVYALAMHQAAMAGRLAQFELEAQTSLAMSSARYRRPGQDWAPISST